MTCQFNVRHDINGDSGCFEVFDRSTGTAVASGMPRAEAEADARRRNQGTSGSPADTAGLDPPEVAALRAAINAYVAWVGHHSRILVAQAAQALDELRAELHHADRLIVEQQTRIGELYTLFPGWDDDES